MIGTSISHYKILEAQATSAFQHDNICVIHEIDETPHGQLFIAMDCYDGETLKEKIARGQVAMEEALDIACQVSAGLSKAHGAGMVHRDIKPANVMVTRDGVAKMLDFGLAKLAGQTKVTKTGTTVGTVSYMSPECLGVNIKFPSDFTDAPYSLVATAADTLPQKVDLPFSLINKPSRAIDSVPPAYNEFFPAWVLSENLYSVLRNEGKYKKRNKARRTQFVFDVFRRDIVEKMIVARDRLQNVEKVKELYTDKDVPGLGKNFMTEESRVKGIEVYSFYLEYFALKGLAARVAALVASGERARMVKSEMDALIAKLGD